MLVTWLTELSYVTINISVNILITFFLKVFSVV